MRETGHSKMAIFEQEQSEPKISEEQQTCINKNKKKG